MYLTHIAAALANSSVRTLSQQEELPLLRDHLLRLDRNSRRDRFHGFMDDSFIERYAEKCADDARRSSPSLKTAWFGARRSCIRRTSHLIRSPRSPSASKRQCVGGVSAASCSAS